MNIVSLSGRASVVLMLLFACFDSNGAATEEATPQRKNPADALAWKSGPVKGDLRDRAQITVPVGFRFLEAKDAAKLLVMAGNQSSGRELGLLENVEKKWWVILEFDEVGYVKDDDKDKLDADKLLTAIKKGTEEGNKYRSKQGIPPMTILGWHVKPNYNDQTKNLEWSILAESEGRRFVNYNVRMLGRHGVTEMTLIDGIETVDASLPDFRSLLSQFTYNTGQSYAEYRQGDKVAQYGLGALVLGGAAAVAYKTGFLALIAAFFKKGWKLIVIAGVAVVAFVRKLILGGSSSRAE